MKAIGAAWATFCIACLIVLVIIAVCWSWGFSMGCNQYLKRASDANTIELASQNLATAITYIEKHDLTNGNTGVILTQPENDIGFWYANLKASMGELEKVKPETPQLERSNILMKLRETLLDHGEKGVSVTRPDGISMYPHNKLFFWVVLLFIITGGIGLACAIFCEEPYRKW